MAIPGYKPTIEAATPATLATLLPLEAANGSRVATVATRRNPNIHPDSVVERSAIMEFDGELTRDQANMAAAMDADMRRTPMDNPEGIREYGAYIEAWTPTAPGDLPDIPPAAVGNGALWATWWAKLEGVCHE